VFRRQIAADIAARSLAIASYSLKELIHYYNRHFAEAVTAADATFLLANKRLADAASAPDAFILLLQKSLDDAIVVSDGVSFSFGQRLEDVSSPIDAVSITVEKLFSEIVSVSDTARIGSYDSETLGDTIGATDFSFVGVMKVLAEAVTASEGFSLAVTNAPPRSLLNGYPTGDFTLGD
jgi:hypothetical protein